MPGCRERWAVTGMSIAGWLWNYRAHCLLLLDGLHVACLTHAISVFRLQLALSVRKIPLPSLAYHTAACGSSLKIEGKLDLGANPQRHTPAAH